MTSQRHRDLINAQRNQKDEFYTQLSDIENEMVYYREHFKGKVIYCNCDDPQWSNFYKHFYTQFEFYELKKLISTHYNYDPKNSTFKLEYDGETEVQIPLALNGDFRSYECINILVDEADIVVTNPPFSLLGEYISQLMLYKKKFIVMGNINSVSLNDIRPWFTKNKVWLGCSIKSGDVEFQVPNSYPLNAAGTRTDKNGSKFIRVKGVRWYTNLPHNQRKEKLELNEIYKPDKYPTYENYNAIEIGYGHKTNKVRKIPRDYEGEMGVPITFLDRYNPDQFEIVGFARDLHKTDGGRLNDQFKLDGKELYTRIVIKHKKGNRNGY